MDSPGRIGSKILIHCPHCEAAALATVAGEMQWYDPERGPPCLYELATCEKCSEPILAVEEDFGQGWDGDPIVLWPKQQRPLSLKVPEILRREYEEARRCFSAKAYTATAVMVRRILEAVCRDQGITNNRMTLANMLKELKESDKIDGRLFEWSQELRVLGNQGAHFAETSVSREDAADALALAEALLDYLYVLSAQFAEFKERRTNAKQPGEQTSSSENK